MAMSADNYWFVRKREDSRFGISMRFASSYYLDTDSEFTNKEWVGPAPEDQEVYLTAAEAIFAAHRLERENWAEYGVSLGLGVIEDVGS